MMTAYIYQQICDYNTNSAYENCIYGGSVYDSRDCTDCGIDGLDCHTSLCDADESDIEPTTKRAIALALQYDCVIGARAFDCGGEMVVALLTTPFYLKSERDEKKQSIHAELCESLSRDAITVTFDIEVYRKIKDRLTEEQMQSLLLLAKSR